MQCQSLPSLKLAKVEALVFRAPIAKPVQTSFGEMYDRPALLVRIEDCDGAVGWGEIWCNFPSVGAEHRARMLEVYMAPILLEQAWDSPQQAFAHLTRRLWVLGLQSGEPGTIAQAIAGADIAMWDLVARKLGQPLWRLWGGGSEIAVYASGISPGEPERIAAAKYREGYRAFKLKVGFGQDRDCANLRGLRESLGADVTLMVDANQAWTVEVAVDMSRRLANYEPIWLEEPIAADHTLDQWTRLAQQSAVPLAAGENMRGEACFSAAAGSTAFAVIQPDMGKWGGFSGCVPVGKAALDRGKLFCPHWLGGGIGLVASMHLKAIVGGAGYVEVDSNPNPLRDRLAQPYLHPDQGQIRLSTEPGLGVVPDLALLKEFRAKH